MKKYRIILIILLIFALIPISINFYVINVTKSKINSIDILAEEYDIALVLGCSVLSNGSPSKMLKDRLDTAIDLYNEGKVKQILVSGDHSNNYSEVLSMEAYLKNNQVQEKDILKDYTGFSTSESLINYKNNFEDKSVVIVTQRYHLYRALFIAEDLGVSAIGVYAKEISYYGNLFREIREILARNKDFILFKFF